jgi:superfamily II DNA or RNA helicase
METIQKLDLKKRLVMRPYQDIIVTDIINHFNSGKPYVLGSCPSSGKTEMAIETLIRLMEMGLVNRVLILAHSTNVLKENFYNRLLTYFKDDDVEIMQGQKNYNYDCRVQVMIPQNIKHIKTEFDMIITDEAHHNVLAEDGNYSRIVEMVKPKFQLLLTGTPSKFVRENALDETQPYHINTVGMDMVGFEYFHDVRFDLIKSAYRFTNNDYNQYQDLKEDTVFGFEETERTVNNVIIGAVRNIALRNGIELPKDSNFVSEGRKLIKSGKFGKTLIMCRNIQQANQVAEIITKLFKVQVRVSQSQNDTDSKELERFKEGKFDFLCVVKRAREGYDDSKIVNLIDITMTHNIDLIYQMFCRVVRLDENNPNPKLYIKVTSIAEGMPEYTMNIMTAALMLGATENLRMFNGSNFRNIVMPRVERNPDEDEDVDGDDGDVTVDGVVDIVNGEGNTIRRRAISDLMALDLIKIFVEDEQNLISGNDRYAMTTLNDSLNKLNGYQDFYGDKEGYFKLCKRENLTNSESWRISYKEFSNRDGLKYHSTPWVLFNQSSSVFFGECFSKKSFYDDKVGYFEIIKKNKLTPKNYGKSYKKISVELGVKLHSTPWKIFNLTQKEFFLECYPENSFYDDKEGYFILFRKEAITSAPKWIEKREVLSDRDNIKYHANPWKFFKQTEKEFFDECYPNKEKFYDDKKGYFDLIRKEEILYGKQWIKKYKELSNRDNIKYHSTPWRFFKQAEKEFFLECYPENSFYDDKEGYFILFRKEVITNSEIWIKKYKELSTKNKVKYRSEPWSFFQQTSKQFFDEFKEWLKQYGVDKQTSKKAYLGKFSELNKKWNTSNSDATFKKLKKDKSEWKEYHKLYSEARKKWEDIPYIEISKKIKDRPEWIVGDMGCGENLLKNKVKNKVHSFDFVAIDETVTACDLSCLPLDNEVLDVAVFSLSLMGTNYSEYLKEAYRVLKPYGMIMISEPRQRWSDDEGVLDEARVKSVLTDAGFKVAGEIRLTEKFIYFDGIK